MVAQISSSSYSMWPTSSPISSAEAMRTVTCQSSSRRRRCQVLQSRLRVWSVWSMSYSAICTSSFNLRLGLVNTRCRTRSWLQTAMAKTPEEMRRYKTEWAARKRASMTPGERERRRLADLKSYNKHKDRRLKIAREWKARNKQRVEAYRAEHYRTNIEKQAAQAKAWRDANRERHQSIKKAWEAANAPERKVRQAANRSRQEYKVRRNDNARVRYVNDPQYNIRVS